MLSSKIAAVAETLRDLTQDKIISAKQVRDAVRLLRRYSDDVAELEALTVPAEARVSEGGLPDGVVSLASRRRHFPPAPSLGAPPFGGGDAA